MTIKYTEEEMRLENELKEKFFTLKIKSEDNTFETIVTNGEAIDQSTAFSVPNHGPLTQEKLKESPLESLIKKSPYAQKEPDMNQIINDFNSLGKKEAPKSLFTITNQFFGWIFSLFSMPFKRLQPGELRLIHRNNNPELSINSIDRQRIQMSFNPTDTCAELGTFKQTDQVIGDFGHYIINVPRGHYGKVMLGNESCLYGEGYHVIHHPNASLNKTKDFTTSVNEPHIQLGDIHIFNVPKGEFAKVVIGNDYQLLPEGRHNIREPRLTFEGFTSSGDEYIRHGNIHRFNLEAGKMALTKSGGNYQILGNGIHFIQDPNLTCEKYATQTNENVSHGNLHFLNVPIGKMALVLEDNTPKILQGGRHVIKHSNFVVNRFEYVNSPYVKHNDLHHVMVAPGNIALVSVENETHILVGRKEPYLFQSNNFSIMKNEDGYTFPQDSKHLNFNGLHYILPDQGEVPYLYDGGKLITFNEKKLTDEEEQPAQEDNDHKVLVINSPTARFGGFLDTRLQTLEFPSKEVESERINELDITKQNARYDSFMTRDGNNVGVRFMVTYRITNPQEALKTLKSQEEIVRHIERVVNADMGAAISVTALNDITSTGSNITSATKSPLAQSCSQTQETSWQEHVKSELKRDLADYGIELGRLNIEEWIVLDPDVRKQMETQSKELSGSRAEQNALMVQYETQQLQLKQEREILKGKKDNQLSKTELALAETKGEQDVATQAASSLAKIAEIHLERAELDAKAGILPAQKEAALLDNPNYLKMQITKEMADAIKGSKLLEAAQVGACAASMSPFSQSNSLGANPMQNCLAQMQQFGLFNQNALPQTTDEKAVLEQGIRDSKL